MSHLSASQGAGFAICLLKAAPYLEQIEQMCRTHFPGSLHTVSVTRGNVCAEFDSLEAAFNAILLFQNNPVAGRKLQCRPAPPPSGCGSVQPSTIADNNTVVDFDTSQVYLSCMRAYDERHPRRSSESGDLRVGYTCGIYVTDICNNSHFLGIENKDTYTDLFRTLKHIMDSSSGRLGDSDSFVRVADDAEGLSRGYIVKKYPGTADVYLIDWGYVKSYRQSLLSRLSSRALSFVRPLARLFEIAGAPSDLPFPELLSLPMLFQVKVMAVSTHLLTHTVKVKFNGQDLIDYYYDPELVQQACLLDSNQQSGESSLVSVEEWLLNTDDTNLSHIPEAPLSPPDDEALADLIESVELGDSVSAINAHSPPLKPCSQPAAPKFTFLSSELALKPGSTVPVLVTYVVLPTFFNFIPITRKSSVYRDSIQSDLISFIDSIPVPSEENVPRALCKCVRIHNQPFRVVVKSRLHNYEKHKLMRVQLIDYGTEAVVRSDDIYQCPDSILKYPILRFNGLLHGLNPSRDKRWTAEETSAFREMTEGKTFDAKIMKFNAGSAAPSYYLDLKFPASKQSVTNLMNDFGYGALFRK